MRDLYRIVLLSVALVSGCAAGPTVRVDKDPAVNMTTYRTFGFYEHPATDRAGYSTIMTARLKQATREQLERLGYVYDERKPQLRVNFFLNIADRQQVTATPAPGGYYRYRVGRYGVWGGYPYDVQTIQYKAGTLAVDLVDVKTSSLVWHGLAEGKVKRDAYRHPDAAVDSVIADIFRSFPAQMTT